jgi:VIT1/CCC1 family predicted Fe2+/Mn2+ transporter
LPLIVAALAPASAVIEIVAIASLISLAVLGALAAGAGGASRIRGAVRVTFWSALALAITALVGHLFGATA